MPRILKITESEIDALVNESDSLLNSLMDMHDRIQKGYVDPANPENTLRRAMHFAAIATRASAMVPAENRLGKIAVTSPAVDQLDLRLIAGGSPDRPHR